MSANKRFSFLDGLSGLYLPTQRLVAARLGQKVLSNPDLMAISGEIQQAIEMNSQEGTSRVLLIIDQLDLFLATGNERISVVEIKEMLMELREVHSTCSVAVINACS